MATLKMTTTLLPLILSLICFSTVLCKPKKAGSFHDLMHRNADSCERCLPGWGVVRMCDDVYPTVCEVCPEGSWSPEEPHLSPCVACSLCGPELYEDIKCGPTMDTVCDSCKNSNGQFNEDFVRKCVPQQSSIKSLLDPTGKHPSRVRDNLIYNNIRFNADKLNTAADPLQKSLADKHHQYWKEGTEAQNVPAVNFKPSYHDYPIDSLIHSQRRKVYILIGLSSFVFCATIVFLGCLIRNRCKSQRDYSRLYTSLGEHEKALIKDSAMRIEQGQSKLLSPAVRNKDVAVFEYGGPMIRVHENPLEPFLESDRNCPEVGISGDSTPSTSRQNC